MSNSECNHANIIVDPILKKIPRPNYAELKLLYEELDSMAKEIGKILICSAFFDTERNIVYFDKMSKEDIVNLIKKNPNVMVPFFVTICGFSARELERLYGIQDVYSLRRNINESKLEMFSNAVKEHLKHNLSLETVLYKFYKNWEEHQKRHRRAERVEEYVIKILNERGYNANKVVIECKDKKREVDCAILPPDTTSDSKDLNILVAIQIRTGVFRDLVKRAKEFSTEFDELMYCYPNTKFVVLFLVPPHERDRLKEIRERIESERLGKRPYDLVLLDLQDVENLLLKKLEEWGIPKKSR